MKYLHLPIINCFFLFFVLSGYGGDRYEEEFSDHDLEIFKEADSLFFIYEYEKSYELYLQVIANNNNSQNVDRIIYGHIRKGIIERKFNQLDKSKQTFSSIKSIVESDKFNDSELAGFYFHSLGELYEFLHMNDSAYYYLSKAIDLKSKLYGINSCYLAESLTEMGELFFYHIANYELSEKYARQAFAIIQDCDIDQSNLKTLVYFLLGKLYWQRYEFNTALTFTEKSIYEESGKDIPNGALLANMHSSLSRIHKTLHHNEKAVQYAQSSIDLLNKFDKTNTYNYYYYNYTLAIALLENQEYDKAIALLEGLLDQFSDGDHDKNAIYQSVYQYQLAMNYANVGDTIRCLALINNIYDQLIDFYGGKCAENANLLDKRIADIYIQLNEIDNAKAILKQLINCHESRSNQSNYNYYELANIYQMSYEINLLESQNFDRNVQQDIRMADSLFLLSKIESIWQTSKLNASEDQSQDFYKKVIGRLFESYSSGPTNKDLEELIFSLVESSKLGLLYEKLNQKVDLENIGIPDSVNNHLKEVKEEIAILETASQENDLDIVRLELLYQTEQNIINAYRDSSKILNKLSYFINKVSLPTAQSHLASNEMILQYIRIDNQFICIKILPDDVVFHSFAIDRDLEQFIQFYHHYKPNITTTSDIHNFEQQAYILYNRLIGSIPDDVKHILIIPDDLLYELPFDALITEKSDANSYSQLNYLIKTVAISYDYSVSHHMNIEAVHSPIKKAYGVFGNSQTINTKEESRKLKQLFRNFKYSSNKEEILEQLSIVDLVHFGAHGLSNTQNLFANYLSISDNEKLYEYEMAQMDLKSALIYINACESGKGKFIDGEGVFSISRTMLQSGCKSVIASLWSIPDQSASEIAVNFYNSLKQKKINQPAYALQKAKLDFLKHSNKTNAHPYYWASLSSIGSNQPILISRKYPLRILFMALIAVLAISLTGYKLASRFKR
ncbi:MAG: CHAT domain-containing tetratricopeptide repeat protein [Chitinophagales bacterium]